MKEKELSTYPIWRFDKDKGKIDYIFVSIDRVDGIFNITTRGAKPVELTEGLNEIRYCSIMLKIKLKFHRVISKLGNIC